MKYIRTKDGKIVKHPHPNEEVFTSKYEIIKEADTIEELCDELLVIRKNEKPIMLSYRDILRHKERYSMPYDKHCYYYGAIWTDWGLKYIAKMNDKGELELI